MTSLLIPRGTRRSAPALRSAHPVDRLFDDVWRGFGVAPAGQARFVPRLDVRETDTEYTVSAELPGLDENDIEISLEENVLTIRGEKRAPEAEENSGYRVRESSAGKFERKLALPTEVEADAVTATAKHGVVTIRLPKPPEVQPQTRTIPVTTD